MKLLGLTVWIVSCLFTRNRAVDPRMRLNDEETESNEITIYPKTQKVMEGSPMVFTCISSGDDVTSMRWKNGFKPINPTRDNANVRFITDNISVLRINEADMKIHKKKITCEGISSTTRNVVKAQASVKIFKRGRSRKNFPVLTDYPRSPIKIDQSEYKLVLACKSDIIPGSRESPKWRWIKNGNIDLELSIHHDDDDDDEIRLLMPRPGVLEITDIQVSDSGTYECVAENKRGSAYSEPISVQVVGPRTLFEHEAIRPSFQTSSEGPGSLMAKENCTDRNGLMVPDLAIYHPSLDPCIECQCVNGEPDFCTEIACDAPPCRDYELIEGTCCGFICPGDEKHAETHGEGGSCQPYQGSYCKEFIQKNIIFTNSHHTQDQIEGKLAMLFGGAGMLSESCMEHILPFICFYTVPMCDTGAVIPRGRPVCREDCELVANTCQDEFYVFRDEIIDGANVLPQCAGLPSRDDEAENCVSFEKYIDIDDDIDTDDYEYEDVDFEGTNCVDRHGNSVDDGDLFLPEEDPCIACTCNNGAREGCMTVACEKPHCENFVRSSDSCCGYTCIESHVANDTLGFCRSYDGSVVENGEQYQPTSDPCLQCLCAGGRKGPCRSIECQPPDCLNPKRVPGLCCSFSCTTPELDPGFFKDRCIDVNGSRVENGDFQPGSDPCTTCQCVNGRKESCMSVGCVPPDCPNREPVPGKCCQFICPDTLVTETNEPCIDVNGTRVYNGDYQPGLDPCTTCSCHMGRKQRCMTVACVPPPDCSTPKPIPGVCCEFTCPETDDNYDLEKRERCIDNNGTMVRFGKYQPGSDPCEICHCSSGWKDMCMNVGCIPPPCPNPEPVPGVCCKFICREPTKIPLMQTPEDPGTLSVQQVGSSSVIVQWKLKRRLSLQNPMVNLLYNCTMNGTLTNVTVPANKTHLILPDLHHNTRYNFMLVLQEAEEVTFLDSVGFTLDGRAGRTLHLRDVAHGNVYETRGPDRGFGPLSTVENKDDVHIMIDSFHRAETTRRDFPQCSIRKGCGAVKFYMYKYDGKLLPIVTLLFADDRDFNWAKAHL